MRNRIVDNFFRVGIIAFGIIGIVIIILAASKYNIEGAKIRDATDIRRYIDEEAGVVCWLSGYRDNISCLPLLQTNLE